MGWACKVRIRGHVYCELCRSCHSIPCPLHGFLESLLVGVRKPTDTGCHHLSPPVTTHAWVECVLMGSVVLHGIRC